ncbi:MAG: thioredoxin family protein [Acidobacteriota bacterium]
MRMMRVAAVAVVLGMALTARAAEKIFDPSRDSETDLKAAIAQAKAEHKNILMDVGGNWCSWCVLVERTMHEDAELNALLSKNYVLLHVDFSQGHENTEFLKHYPKPTGYPAWYVLSPSGKLLKAEDTSELEQTHKLAAGYNRDALKQFLTENAPKP